MKRTSLALILGSLFSISASPLPKIYQVISSHPHDVRELTPYIKTVKSEGRLWLVELTTPAPAHVLENLRPVNLSSVRHYEVTEKARMAPSPMIKEMLSRIDVPSIKSDVEMLANYKTRIVGSADNQKAIAQLKEILISFGLSVKQICYRADACSLVADKAGDGSSDKVIMLMGHMDSVGKNFAGADDNASGTAVLIEVAKVLKDYSNKKTMRFFITNGEESGLYGAQHYADTLQKTGEIKKLALTINMDMVGYNSNGIVELETDEQYEELAKWFSSLASTYTTLKSKITIGAWGSDHVPFIQGGVPTLLTIEDWSTKTPCYHMECDKPAALNYNYAGEIAKLNMAAMLTKDMEGN